jgi:ribosomal protein S8
MCRSSGFHCHYVLSTSRGLLSSEEALSRKIGGELLVQILF